MCMNLRFRITPCEPACAKNATAHHVKPSIPSSPYLKLCFGFDCFGLTPFFDTSSLLACATVAFKWTAGRMVKVDVRCGAGGSAWDAPAQISAHQTWVRAFANTSLKASFMIGSYTCKDSVKKRTGIVPQILWSLVPKEGWLGVLNASKSPPTATHSRWPTVNNVTWIQKKKLTAKYHLPDVSILAKTSICKISNVIALAKKVAPFSEGEESYCPLQVTRLNDMRTGTLPGTQVPIGTYRYFGCNF